LSSMTRKMCEPSERSRKKFRSSESSAQPCDGLQWMSPEEAAAITVPIADVATRLPAVMHEYGVAIIEGVVTGEELDALLEAWARDLRGLVDEEAMAAAPQSVQEAYGRFLREGPSAFPLKASKFFTTMAGFAVDRCLCHGEFAWAVRKHARVHDVFKAMFGDAPLVTSMDVPFFTPSDVGKGPACPWGSAHVDQNLHDSRGDLGTISEYQGVLYAWACRPENESTATVVWPRSYREGDETCPYATLMEDQASKRLGQFGMHYTQLEMMAGDGQLDLKKRFLQEARRVPVPAGGLLLWNSKTVHTGAQRGPRLAQPVCLEPLARRSEHERLGKLRMAALGLPSMHWASHAIQHDCVRLRAGYLTTGAEVPASEAQSPRDVVLPLQNTVRPWCATEGSLQALQSAEGRALVRSSGDLERYAQLLEKCVSEEAKAII